MEDAYGTLSISKIFLPAIEWKGKEDDEYDRHKMEILDKKALGTIRLCLVVLLAFNISKEMTK